MANDDVKFKIGAEDTGSAGVFEQLEAAAAESAERIKASFESINQTFETLQTAFVALTAVFAGGEAFKEAIQGNVSLNTESVKLGKTLGISATQASVLKVALGATFVTQDQLSVGAAKVDQALVKNESAFSNLGVATRDANGNFRNTFDILLDTNERLLQFKEGTDRNVEGAKIFGRSWTEVSETLRITRQAMQEAKEIADALGLTVGQESVASSQRYRVAMEEVHLVIEALGNAIAAHVMPALSTLGEWLKSVGPSAVAICRGAFQVLTTIVDAVTDSFKALGQLALDVLREIAQAITSAFGGTSITTMEFFMNVVRAIEVAFIGLRTGVQEIAQIFGTGFEFMAASARMFANVVKHALTLDWKGANAAFMTGAAEMQQIWDSRTKNMVDIAEKARQDIDHALMDPIGDKPKETPTPKPAGGQNSTGGNESKLPQLTERLEAFKANFAEQLAAQGDFAEFSKQMDRSYWEAILDQTHLSTADRLAVQKKIAGDTIAIAKEGYEGELAALKAQEAQYKGNLDAKLQIAKEYAAKVAAAEGGNSKAAQEAQAQVIAIEREKAAQKLQIDTTNQNAIEQSQLSAIDREEATDQQRVANFQETRAQMLAKEEQYEDQRYQIKLQALEHEKQLALDSPDGNPEKVAQINAQILALANQHVGQMQKLQQQSAQLSQQYWTTAFQSIASGFTNVVSGFLRGTLTFSQAVKQMGDAVAGAISNMLAQMATQWLENLIIQKTSTLSGAMSAIAASAAQAGAGAYAAIAGIPYVGPELAPAAAATAYAGALSFGALASASAAGGYDIGSSVSPIVKTHPREMILPSHLADGIRNMTRNGGGGGGGDVHHHHNWNISATDGASMKKMLIDNKSTIAQALQMHLRASGRSTSLYKNG